MAESDTIKEIREQANESDSAFSKLRKRMKKELMFSGGKQWEEEVAKSLEDKKKFAHTFNIIFKHLLLVSGSERRNRSDMRALPQEGADDVMASIFSAVLKWQMSDNYGSYWFSEGFLTGCRIGLGWMTLDVRRDLRDMLADPLGKGEVVIGCANPFNVFPDKNWTKFDLSDCGYIIHRTLVRKSDLKHMHRDMASEIDGMKKGSRLIPDFFKPSYDDNDMMEIVERWKRTYETRTLMIDKTNGQVAEGTRDEFEEFMKLMPPDEHVRVDIIDVDNPKIVLDSLIENTLLIPSRGENPLENLEQYPLIPIRCYFDPVQPEWDLRVMGITRGLMDTQDLFNKLMSEAKYQMITSAWKTVALGPGNDSVTEDEILESGMRILRLKDINQFKEFTSQTFDPKLLEMAGIIKEMFNLIGNNMDQQGLVSDPGGPGIAQQVRLQQGETSNEPIYDNIRLSMEMLGRVLIELSNKCYSSRKIQRIVGNEIELPPDFDEKRKNARYDISVGLFSQSPSNRYYQFIQVQGLIQNGILGMPPEEAQLVIELSDLSVEIKEKLLSMIRARAQAAGQPPVGAGAETASPALPEGEALPTSEEQLIAMMQSRPEMGEPQM